MCMYISSRNHVIRIQPPKNKVSFYAFFDAAVKHLNFVYLISTIAA